MSDSLPKQTPDTFEEVIPTGASRVGFIVLKRVFDIAFSLLCLVPLLMIVPILWIANKRHNPGPLFYCQARMGRGCKPFTVLKFRTMVPVAVEERGYDDPLELDRISPLGAWLRKTRIDELPQAINILRGEMSVVGPRPDVWGHASIYCEVIPGYRDRHTVRPGLSGLAQIRIGYAQGVNATRRKARADLIYIRNMGLRLELLILGQTIVTAVNGFGIDVAALRRFRFGVLTRSPVPIEGTLVAAPSQNALS